MIIFQKIIKREDLRSNPKVLYLFGDNDQRKEFGGQAKEMRGEPNAVGIRTKHSPWRPFKGAQSDSSFYSDNNFQENVGKMIADMSRLWGFLAAGGTIVLPIDGIGTGLAELETRAPKTFWFLQDTLARLTDKS